MASSFSSSRTVYASPTDEIAAIIKKLQRSRGSAAVLVANNCPVLHSIENLEHLRHQAIDLGIDLTLVCGDRAVRGLAGRVGINAVSSLAAIHPEARSKLNAEFGEEDLAVSGDTSQDPGATRGKAGQAAETATHAAASGTASGHRHDSLKPITSLSPKDERRATRRERSRTSLPIDRSLSTVLALATIVVVALFIVWGAVYVVLPSATVQLTPVQQQYSTELQLTADPQIGRLDAAAGKIPAQRVLIEETDELTAAATGVKDEPVGRAEGSVTFRNQIAQEVVVPRGTVVLTNDNRRFVTAVPITVLPTSAIDERFGWSRVKVVAEEVGPIGNVEVGTITHIEDQSLNQRLTVENDTPIQGGGLRETRFVTEEDRLLLYETLRQELLLRAWNRLGERIKVAESVFVPWDADVIVEQAEYDKEVGQPADDVTLRMKVKLRGTAFSSKYLTEVAPMILERIVENQFESFALLANSLTLGEPGGWGISEGVVHFTLLAQGDLVSTWNLGTIQRALANSTREEAEEYLNNLEGVADYSLELGPSWYDRMPRLWFRITIEVVEPLQVAA